MNKIIAEAVGKKNQKNVLCFINLSSQLRRLYQGKQSNFP